MNRKNKILYLLLFYAISLTFPYTSLYGKKSSRATDGKTANGCSYQIINGKYFYKCPDGETNTDEYSSNADAPSTNYVAPGQYPEQIKEPAVVSNAPILPPTVASPSLPQNERNVPVLEKSISVEREERDEGVFGEMIYTGLGLGSTHFTDDDSLNGSLTSYAVVVGTNIDDFVGLELGYSYQNSDIFLGLENRSGGAIKTPYTQNLSGSNSNVNPFNSADDAYDTRFTAHLLTLESQIHFTDAQRIFRPFVGIGLGYKNTSLKEHFPSGTIGASNSSVSQDCLGVPASVGIKIRVSHHFQIAGIFRYFLPISTSDPDWNSQARPFSTASTARNLFQFSDTKLTSSSLSQLGATLQYVF